MKLVTLVDGSRDGRLAVASADLTRHIPATAIAATLQQALENWTRIKPRLEELAASLEDDPALGEPLDLKQVLAPLPRAWQWLDGSAFDCHGELMSKVFDMAPLPNKPPLMYQGVSDRFFPPYGAIPFNSEADGIDFEGEFGIIVDDVPQGIGVEDAQAHICLVVQINDWSLRRLAPIEMRTGFGWIQAKPPCGMAPAAVTVDTLGAAWRDARVDLDLHVWWNGAQFGRANGYPMSSSFAELIAHAAATRPLCAGTVIGSGTVSNPNYREIGSSCIAERRGIEMLDEGEPRTGFMRFGDTVRMEALGADGHSVFGALEQQVVSL